MRFLGLILVLVLGAPPAFAAGSRAPEELSVRGVVTALWDAFVDLVFGADGGGGTTTNGDGGPHMDPNGNPTGP
jgi:hypothetical protein